MIKILIIGPAPQNIGGISIHIRRLINLLKDQYAFDIVDEGHQRFDGVFNLRSKNIFIYLNKIFHADIIHIHSGAFILRACHIFICRILLRKFTIVTVHRDPTIEGKIGLTKWLLSKCNHVIMVNAKGYGVMHTDSNCKYHMIPAFLPPILEEEPELPEDLIRWVKRIRKDERSKLMISNAWNLVLNKGEDLYGLDLCISSMKEIKGKGLTNYYLIFVVASNTNQQSLMKHYKEQIQEFGLTENILIRESPLSFVRLINLADIVLRTTNTDGDAISIREAIYFEKPVIASDVVDRPKETILFKNRDVEDLTRAILSVNNEDNQLNSDKTNFRQVYTEIYRN